MLEMLTGLDIIIQKNDQPGMRLEEHASGEMHHHISPVSHTIEGCLMISTPASYDGAHRCTWEGQPDSVDSSEALKWYLVEAI